MEKQKNMQVTEKENIVIKSPKKLIKRILLLAIISLLLAFAYYFHVMIWPMYIEEQRSLLIDVDLENTTPDNPVFIIRISNNGKRFFTCEEKFTLEKYTGDEQKNVTDMSQFIDAPFKEGVVFSTEIIELDVGDTIEATIDLRDYIEGPYLGKFGITKEFTEYREKGGRKIGPLPYACHFGIEADEK